MTAQDAARQQASEARELAKQERAEAAALDRVAHPLLDHLIAEHLERAKQAEIVASVLEDLAGIQREVAS